MKTALTAIVALVLLGQNCAFAATCLPTSCTGQISILDIEANGEAYVGLIGGVAGLTGCTPNAGEEQFFTLSTTSANWTLVYNTLLEATVHSTQVTIVALPNSTGCTIKYVTVGNGQ
jgi:hypothetical protein